MPHFVTAQHAPLTPTGCCLCRTPGGPFVDTGRDLPVVGERAVWRLYVCQACAHDLGRAFGMLDAEQAGRLRANVRTLETELELVRNRLAEREDRVTLKLSDLGTVIRGLVPAGGANVTEAATPEPAPELEPVKPRRKRGRAAA